jgi:hypothetical protein
LRLRRRRTIERVSIEGGASPEEVAKVQKLFADSGFSVDVDAGLPLSGGPPTDLVWGIYVFLGVPVAAFFSTLGAEAGKDAYAATKYWIKQIVAARKSPDGTGQISLAGRDGSHLRLSSELPDEALDALRDIDWSTLGDGFLTWDDDRGRWTVAR